MDLMPELRSALHDPGDSSWGKIRWLLERWMGELGPARMRDVALPYCAQHLGRWPDTISRPAPQDWVVRLKRGEPVPALMLATELHVYPSHERTAVERADRLRRVIGSQGTLGLRTLVVDGYEFGEHPPAFLIEHIANSANLARLDIVDADLAPNGLRKLLEGASLRNLRRLGLAGNQLGHTGTGWLARQVDLRQLVRLDVRHNRLTRRALQKLAPRGELVSLERIDYVEGNAYARTWRDAVIRSPHTTKELTSWMSRQ